MQDSSIFLNNSRDDLLQPAAKRQKTGSTFPELHQRVLQGDAKALEEIFQDPIHTHKFKVINGTELLKLEEILGIIDENYKPLISRLFRFEYLDSIFRYFCSLDYEQAKHYTFMVLDIITNEKVSFYLISFYASLLNQIKAERLKSQKTGELKKSNIAAVMEATLPFLLTTRSRESLLKQASNLKKSFNEIVELIGSEIGDLERLVLVSFKRCPSFNDFFFDLKRTLTPMLIAIKQNNFALVKELYLMGEYPLSAAEYAEFIVFKLKFQHEHDFSYWNFSRVGTKQWQDALVDKICKSEVAPNIWLMIYGLNYQRYLCRTSNLLNFFIKQEKFFKKNDKSEDAEFIRSFNRNSENYCGLLIPELGMSFEQSIKIKLNTQSNFVVRIIVDNKVVLLSPIEFAIANRREDLVIEFINSGVDVSFYINTPPLILAIQNDFSIETIQALLLAGASPYLQFQTAGTALTYAALKNRFDVLELFYSFGIDLDFGATSFKPIVVGITSDNPQMVKFLIEHKVSTRDSANISWLNLAIVHNKLEAARVFLELGLGNERYGHISVVNSCRTVEAAHLLLQYGFDPHNDNCLFDNILLQAIRLRHEEFIRMAMKLGVSPLDPSIQKLIIQSETLKPELTKYLEDYKLGLITKKSYYEAFPVALPEEPEFSYNTIFSQVGEPQDEYAQQPLSPLLQRVDTPSLPENIGSIATTSLSATTTSQTIQPQTSAVVEINDDFFNVMFSSIPDAPQPQSPRSPDFSF